MGSAAVKVMEGIHSQLGDLAVEDAKPRAGNTGYEDMPPPAPRIFSTGVMATDITAHFINSAQTLPVGRLVKDELFTLFESVGAVELMDPKMDTGFIKPGDTLDDDYDVHQSLREDQLLGIMDELFCLEVGWHLGHPLSQTIFTSLHIDYLFGSPPGTPLPAFCNPSHTARENLLLRCLTIYCVALIKTCWHVNENVKNEHYYEEEDFVTHTYGRDLFELHTDDNVLVMLEDCYAELHATSASAADAAILSRLRLRCSFLSAVSQAQDRTSSHLSSAWQAVAQQIPGFANSHELSSPVVDSFSVKLQRKLASTVPPRPVVQISFATAVAYLVQLCADAEAMSEVLHFHDSQSLLTFVALFQARKPQPCVYVRTLLQNYLFSDGVILGTHSIRGILDDDLQTLVLPSSVLLDRLNDEVEPPSDPRHIMAQSMEAFRVRAAQSYLDILRTLCQNRCRIRRTLHHAVGDWDNLQLDAEDIDLALQSVTQEKPIMNPTISSEPMFAFPLSSWAYAYKLQTMELYLQLGFELDVYQHWELGGMYWYLSHLTNTRIRHLERIQAMTTRRCEEHQRLQPRGTAPGQSELQFSRSLAFLNFAMLEASATLCMADALSALYTVLRRMGKIAYPNLPYADEATRHELRLKSFLNIGLPEFISYKVLRESTDDESESVSDMLVFAAQAVARAKKNFELLGRLDASTARCRGSEAAWKKNIKDCLRAAIMANISVAAVRKACDADLGARQRLEVEIPGEGERYHSWWVVPKISVKS